MPVAAILDGTDGWEWVGWLAYSGIEPFGPVRDDLRAGTAAAAAANAMGGRSRPADFFTTLRRQSRGHDRAGLIGLCPALCTMG